MAITRGVNCGFVAVAPVDDPNDPGSGMQGYCGALEDTAPAGAVKIIEIGWWCDTASADRGTDVGLYTDDAANDRPDQLLGHLDFSKGTTAGWKRGTVNINVTPGTHYWIAMQLDPGTSTEMDYADVGGNYDYKDGSATALPSPWGVSTGSLTLLPAIYAVYEVAVGTNMKINIGDVFKDIDSIQINIGDVWKDVTKVQINIGDAWKTVFG